MIVLTNWRCKPVRKLGLGQMYCYVGRNKGKNTKSKIVRSLKRQGMAERLASENFLNTSEKILRAPFSVSFSVCLDGSLHHWDTMYASRVWMNALDSLLRNQEKVPATCQLKQKFLQLTHCLRKKPLCACTLFRPYFLASC